MDKANVARVLDINPGRVALSIAEAAEACGLCKRTISDAIRSGDLPAARISTRVLVPRESLVEWVRKHTDTSGALVRPDLSRILSERNRKPRSQPEVVKAGEAL